MSGFRLSVGSVFALFLIPLTALSTAGCGPTGGQSDGGRDLAISDAGRPDLGARDAGPPDLSTADAATDDAGLVDGGSHDGALLDGSPGDLSVRALGPAPVLLGSAGDFVILAKTGVSNVPTSAVTGDVGLSPAAASFITGFSLVRAGAWWTAPQVTGKVYAADNDPPTPVNLGVAIGSMQAAYTDAAGRVKPDFLNLGAGAIGGLTLAPGLYKWNSAVTISSDVTLSGGAADIWILQVTGDLNLAAAKHVLLVGGAKARNVFWQVTGVASLSTGSHFAGIVLSQTGIVLGTGASVEGRLLAQTAVTLAGNAVTQPSP